MRTRTREKYMALKIDSQKAYDRLRWEFIEETLNDIGFPKKMIKLIMACFTSSSVQVVWNGEVSCKFYPLRWIR